MVRAARANGRGGRGGGKSAGGGGAKKGGPWWDWSGQKVAIEFLLDTGEVVDVAVRIIPHDP